jgi:hypothetical protein
MNKIQLSLKVSDWLPASKSMIFKIDTTVDLPKENWDQFISLVDKAEFWKMANTMDAFGFDGATWLLEAVDNQKFHWAERWSPGVESPFGIACQYLVSLAPIKINSSDIY